MTNKRPKKNIFLSIYIGCIISSILLITAMIILINYTNLINENRLFFPRTPNALTDREKTEVINFLKNNVDSEDYSRIEIYDKDFNLISTFAYYELIYNQQKMKNNISQTQKIKNFIMHHQYIHVEIEINNGKTINFHSMHILFNDVEQIIVFYDILNTVYKLNSISALFIIIIIINFSMVYFYNKYN